MWNLKIATQHKLGPISLTAQYFNIGQQPSPAIKKRSRNCHLSKTLSKCSVFLRADDIHEGGWFTDIKSQDQQWDCEKQRKSTSICSYVKRSMKWGDRRRAAPVETDTHPTSMPVANDTLSCVVGHCTFRVTFTKRYKTIKSLPAKI